MHGPLKAWNRILLGTVLFITGYFAILSVVIHYCVWDICQSPQGCVYLFWTDGDEARLLIRLGQRSIPAIKHKLDSPGLSLKTKIQLAWILSSIGDHSRFSTFLEGLNSERSDTQAIAVARMRNFPNQCIEHLPDIVNVQGERKHSIYWSLLEELIFQSSATSQIREKIQDILSECETSKRTLTKEEKDLILSVFEKQPK